MLNNTIAVASFISDSPSTNVVNRVGVPSSLNRETTATGSVAEISAPNSRAVVRSSGNSIHTPTPTMVVDTSRAGIANISTGAISFANCLACRLNPDSKISTGRKMKNTSSGLR